MKKRKILSAILAAVSLVSFTACNKEKETAGGDKPQLIWMLPGNKQADVESINAEASRIMQENGINAELKLEFIDNAAYNERMTMNMASGQNFDLCFTGYINKYETAVDKGGFYELDKFLETSNITDEIPQKILDSAAGYRGHYYAIPNIQAVATQTGLYVLKDLAEEYGLNMDEIKYGNDIEPFLKWVKETHPEKYPFRKGYGGGLKGNVITDTIARCVHVVTSEDGSYNIYTKPDSPDAFFDEMLMADWFEKGYIRSDVATVQDDNLELAKGKYAAWRGSYTPGGVAEHNQKNKDAQAIGVPIGVRYMSAGAGSTAMTAISAKSKNPELAFKVIELANLNKEFYRVLCYGIEGKHYTVDENNVVTFIENSGYYMENANWKIASVFNSYILPGQSPTIWEETKAYNEAATPSAISGFRFDTTPVRTEIAQIEAVVAKYSNLYDPVETYKDQYIKELEDAGMNEIKAEAEKQLAEWEALK